ncbi:hypothetical protein B0E46_09125 [Rhodanobacter sp. B04]|nr:hypothetical protein B0E46_09125 [Rhodanobacter sp. B04]
MGLAVGIAALLYFLWFPPPYFIAAGASRLIILLMGVDVCIGPLLTLLVVSPHKAKRLLKLDLSIIAIIQVIAFAYGVHVIAAARPVFVVAEVDRLVLVSADQLADADLARGSQPIFRRRSWTGPSLVGALPPSNSVDPGAVIKVLEGGKDIDQLPQFYVSYAQVIDRVMHHAIPLPQLKHVTASQRRQLDEIQSTAGSTPLLALPLQRGDHDYTAIMSPETRRPLAILAIEPW